MEYNSIEDFSKFNRIISYFVYVYLGLPDVKAGNALNYREEPSFSESVIGAINLIYNDNKSLKSMGGYINDYNTSITLTDSVDKDYLTLTPKGERVFKKVGKELLRYGKDMKLDTLVEPGIRHQIPDEFLNE